MEETGFFQDRKKGGETIGKIFKTVTGKKLAKELYERSGPLKENYKIQLQT
jgi:hypothetical protein